MKDWEWELRKWHQFVKYIIFDSSRALAYSFNWS